VHGKVGALPTEIMVHWWKAYCPDPALAADPKCSPINVSSSTLRKIDCEILVQTSSADVLLGSGLEYVEKLKQAKVRVTHVMVQGSHSFGLMCDRKNRNLLDEIWKAKVLS
tara:strand:- start:332 stop:664 length:333 start_codon:yes stop_codon:yes gene_type:complete